MSSAPVPPELRDLVLAHLRDVPDFPQPGVLFKDIGPLIGDAAAFARVVEHWRARFSDVDVVAGIDARGFIFGGALAHALGVGFVPVRKAGKLPGPTIERSYDLEYGSATLALQEGALQAGGQVLIVDDVLATGGTAQACCELVESVGARVHGLVMVFEVAGLGGRERLVRWPLEVLAST